jgi:superfamily II DNA/RNA helicase
MPSSITWRSAQKPSASGGCRSSCWTATTSKALARQLFSLTTRCDFATLTYQHLERSQKKTYHYNRHMTACCLYALYQLQPHTPASNAIALPQDPCEYLSRTMVQEGFARLCLDKAGMKPQGRKAVLLDFKQGMCNTLVAAGTSALEVVVSGIALVVKFDQPGSIHDYLRRVGRTTQRSKRCCLLPS